MSGQSQTPGIAVFDVEVSVAGKVVPKDQVFDLEIRQDFDQPDTASVSLANLTTKYSEQLEPGDDLEVKMGQTGGPPAATVFKGELTGIEPTYDTQKPGRVVLRAHNKLHLLARGRKSAAFINVTDKDIVDSVCQSYSLTADYGASPPSIQYTHVYQHNQTDLEFLRLRAARLGFELSVNDTTLRFRKPDYSDSGVKLQFSAAGGLTLFFPRLSTTRQVSEVRVRAFDPTQKKELIGSAKPPSSSKLGDKMGATTDAKKHSGMVVVASDVPIATKEEADTLAMAILSDRMMSYITGRGTSKGNPEIKAGIVVDIDANDKRFDGKYYVASVTHRYLHDGKRNGFNTDFTFRRDAAASAQAQQAAQQQQAKSQPQPQPKPKPPSSQQSQNPAAQQVDWLEVKLIGEDGKPIANERYRLTLSSGEVQEGQLDDQGTVRLNGIDKGSCDLTFPDLDEEAWVPA